MKRSTAGLLNVAISLIFAAAILAAAWWLPNEETRSMVTFVLIAIWFVPFSVLTAEGAGNSVGAEVRCLCRRVKRLFSAEG